MAFSFTTTKKINLPPDPFEASALYAAWKAWARDHLNLSRAIRPVGNESRGGGLYSGASFFVASDWQLVPHDSNHTLVIRGDLIPETDNSGRLDLFQPRTGRTIIVRQEMSSLTQTVAVGSGVTPTDKTDIAAAVRSVILLDGVAFNGAYIDAAVSSAGGGSGGLTPTQAAALAEVQARMAEVWATLWLDAENPVTSTETSATATTLTFGNVEITISKSGAVTTMARQP